jgi:hypothetical protein
MLMHAACACVTLHCDALRENREAAQQGGVCLSETSLMFAYAIRLSSDIDQHTVRYFPSRVAKGSGGGIRHRVYGVAVLLFFSRKTA